MSKSAEENYSHTDHSLEKKRRAKREKVVEVNLEVNLASKNKFQKLTFDRTTQGLF